MEETRPQALYGWNLRRLKPGPLDIGCGIGRNLKHLRGKGVGIDHNQFSVEYARSQGLTAYTTIEFKETEFNRPGRFNSLLLSHVAEHMPYEEYLALLREYLPLVKAGGRVLVFCPQEAGFKSDATHIEFMDLHRLRAAAKETGLRVQREYSFPLPSSIRKDVRLQRIRVRRSQTQGRQYQTGGPAMILLIDNYDSFTYNLYQYLRARRRRRGRAQRRSRSRTSR